MTIHNIRLGFATNSSSTHSLMFTDKKLKDVDCYGDYGWNYFTVASIERKLEYLGAIVGINLQEQYGEFAAQAICEKIGLPYDDAWIDHQSVLSIPFDFKGGLQMEFIKEMIAFFKRDDLVILGGNDNDSEHDSIQYGEVFYLLPSQIFSKDFIARREKGYWVLFNRNTGQKTRFSWPRQDSITPIKSSTPELVDLKITDFCTHRCGFCYQDSDSSGKHADTQKVYSILEELQDLEVFEVAIGGGEPMMHPDILNILKHARALGIVPNFTTKSLGWLHDKLFRENVFEAIGSFAYSPTGFEDLKCYHETLKEIDDIDPRKTTIHIVLGSQPIDQLVDMIAYAVSEMHVNVTILDYKRKGRGADFDPYPYEDGSFLETLGDVIPNCWEREKIGVDTSVALRFKDRLAQIGISEKSYTTQEGAFSMYVNAVEMTCARSSFEIGEEISILTDYGYLKRGAINHCFKGF